MTKLKPNVLNLPKCCDVSVRASGIRRKRASFALISCIALGDWRSRESDIFANEINKFVVHHSGCDDVGQSQVLSNPRATSA